MAVGVIVQGAAFGLARTLRRGSWITAWGLGALLRLLVLVAYAFVADRVLGLPLAPALLSLAAFFFVTTLMESFLLQRVPK
ncbi:MAG: hypothetical protein ACR2GG_00020 [Gemmatimonadaceae bacterium]